MPKDRHCDNADPAPADDADGSSSVDDKAVPTGTRASRRRRGMAVAAAALVILVAGIYVAGFLISGDTTPRKASVAGVSIGHLGRDEAIDTLRSALSEREGTPVDVSAGEDTVSVDPDTAGLSFDYGASVDRSGLGRSWDPRHIWRVLSGGRAHDVVVRVDRVKLADAVTSVADQLDHRPRNATIGFKGTSVATTPGRDGVTVDRTSAGDTIVAAYQDNAAATLAATRTEPEVTDAEVKAVKDSFATPAMSGPVRVTVSGGGSFDVTPAMIAASTSFRTLDSKPRPGLDADKLRQRVETEIAALHLDRPVNAKIAIKKGKPTITPSKNGIDVAGKDLVSAIEPVLTKTGKARTATVSSSGAAPPFSTADARKLGVKEIVGEFTTAYPHADYRNTNLGLAAKKINNTLVKPDEIFSLNDTLGKREKEYGWVDGYVISGGRLVKETAGGISQSATTTYNAAFFAGLEDVEHHPHTLYFPRYPAGREATIYYGSLDLKFRNDTPYGVLMQAFIKPSSPGQQGSITVRVWSTKRYEIKTADATRSNFTSGRTRTVHAANCESQAPIQGFTARFYRSFVRNDKEVRREHYSWTYSPGDEIKCS